MFNRYSERQVIVLASLPAWWRGIGRGALRIGTAVARVATVTEKAELLHDNLGYVSLVAILVVIRAVRDPAFLPWIRLPDAVHTVQARFREMAAGDLASRIQIQGDGVHARQLARELNCALGDLSAMIARWKLLDRAQWDLVETVRIAAERKDLDEVTRQIKLMEKNFEKIGEVHQELIT